MTVPGTAEEVSPSSLYGAFIEIIVENLVEGTQRYRLTYIRPKTYSFAMQTAPCAFVTVNGWRFTVEQSLENIYVPYRSTSIKHIKTH